METAAARAGRSGKASPPSVRGRWTLAATPALGLAAAAPRRPAAALPHAGDVARAEHQGGPPPPSPPAARARRVLAPVLALGLAAAPPARPADPPRRPNVLLIVTDDQGHGDLGFHGNPWVRTPHLDHLARESARLERFYVSPVCSPTRASLLTGRTSYRTGVVDTYLGRSLLRPEEVTLAEMLGAAGYRTGIFGKWHLGDNHPLRPMDQGFQESLVLKGGGLGQPSDFPGGGGYFDPVLLENGRPVKTRGYVSDVITEAAMRFLTASRDTPFFLYLAYNAPHAPLELPERYHALYRDLDLASGFPERGHALPRPIDREQAARVYGMVTNIDEDVGRLLGRLEESGLARETITIFLTDNGPQAPRWTSGLKGRKGTVYEGGIRVPCFVRWPGRIAAGAAIDRPAAHIDLVPTLLEACGVAPPPGVRLDGRSLFPLLEGRATPWPDRTLFFQWHRGEVPELFRAFAARSERWKLVQAQGAEPGKLPGELRFELYDMAADPFEVEDVSAGHPEVVESLRREYEAWFREVGERGYEPPRIHLGSPAEDPVVLTRQDWRGPRAGWRALDSGHWEVLVAREGRYRFTLRFQEPVQGTAGLSLGAAALERPVPERTFEVTLGPVLLAPGPGRLEAWLAPGPGRERAGPHQVEVERTEGAESRPGAPAALAASPPAAERTNVVLILADDLGWGDLGCYGHPRFKTPELDRLASQGARLTDFYAPFPVCAPSRAALLTGRYPFRSGLTRNPVPAGDPLEKDADHLGLSPEELTLGELFRAAGHATALFGKWHLGHRPEFRPTRRGFEEYLGVLYSNDMHPVELHDGELVVEYPVVQATLARRLTERAVSFIEKNRARPFLLCLWPHAPHKPLAVSEGFYKKSGVGLYGDAIAELDFGVGQVLSKLRELDLERKTLVVFTSDNGPWYGGSTGGLRGMKGQSWEGGLRVPFIARWPGRIPAGGVIRGPAILMDVFPTALAAAGIPIPGDRAIDGRDLLPLLASGAAPPHDALFFFRGQALAAVRSGRWKLHLSAPGPREEKVWAPGDPWDDARRPDGVTILAPFEQAHPSQFPGLRSGDPGQAGALFDLEGDPREEKDVSPAHPEVVERLQALAGKLRAEMPAPRGEAKPAGQKKRRGGNRRRARGFSALPRRP